MEPLVTSPSMESPSDLDASCSSSDTTVRASEDDLSISEFEFDLESQKSQLLETANAPNAIEYSVAAPVKLLYLGCYFALNLALTIYNKAVLQKVSQGVMK